MATNTYSFTGIDGKKIATLLDLWNEVKTITDSEETLSMPTDVANNLGEYAKTKTPRMSEWKGTYISDTANAQYYTPTKKIYADYLQNWLGISGVTFETSTMKTDAFTLSVGGSYENTQTVRGENLTFSVTTSSKCGCVSFTGCYSHNSCGCNKDCTSHNDCSCDKDCVGDCSCNSCNQADNDTYGGTCTCYAVTTPVECGCNSGYGPCSPDTDCGCYGQEGYWDCISDVRDCNCNGCNGAECESKGSYCDCYAEYSASCPTNGDCCECYEGQSDIGAQCNGYGDDKSCSCYSETACGCNTQGSCTCKEGNTTNICNYKCEGQTPCDCNTGYSTICDCYGNEPKCDCVQCNDVFGSYCRGQECDGDCPSHGCPGHCWCHIGDMECNPYVPCDTDNNCPSYDPCVTDTCKCFSEWVGDICEEYCLTHNETYVPCAENNCTCNDAYGTCQSHNELCTANNCNGAVCAAEYSCSCDNEEQSCSSNCSHTATSCSPDDGSGIPCPDNTDSCNPYNEGQSCPANGCTKYDADGEYCYSVTDPKWIDPCRWDWDGRWCVGYDTSCSCYDHEPCSSKEEVWDECDDNCDCNNGHCEGKCASNCAGNCGCYGAQQSCGSNCDCYSVWCSTYSSCSCYSDDYGCSCNGTYSSTYGCSCNNVYESTSCSCNNGYCSGAYNCGPYSA